jgi:cysteinyl-tRNA synthetase
MHGEFLVVDKGKMSKSVGNFLTVKTLRDEGVDPLHYRFFCLGSHYRSQLFFSFEALGGARNSFEALKNRVISWKLAPKQKVDATKVEAFKSRFWGAMMNDLDTPVALSVMWEMAKDTGLNPAEKLELIRDFDQVLGFGVDAFEKPELNAELLDLVQKREQARKDKDWPKADTLRKEIAEKGLQVMDTAAGSEWYYAYKD